MLSIVSHVQGMLGRNNPFVPSASAVSVNYPLAKS